MSSSYWVSVNKLVARRVTYDTLHMVLEPAFKDAGLEKNVNYGEIDNAQRIFTVQIWLDPKALAIALALGVSMRH